MTLRQVRALLKKADPNCKPGDKGYDESLFLLSAAVVGPDCEKIARFTRLPQEQCQKLAAIAKRQKIFVRDKLSVDWSSDVGFYLDVATLCGWIKRVTPAKKDNGKA